MKNIKYLIGFFIILTAAFSCVEDNIIEDTTPPVVGSVLKLNEIMSKDVNDGPDWIEVYNMGDEDMDISGYFLNDKDVADGGFQIPDGTIIKAHGFYVVDETVSGVKISSGGEDVSLAKPDKTVIDHTKTPDMSQNVGLTWAREIDGEGDWIISNATPGASNGSAENVPPILEASPLTEFTDVYEVSASDADGIASVKLVIMINGGVQSIDMALVEGKYKTSVPKGKVGDVVKYYVVATDNTGLTTYYPENGSENPDEFSVAGGFIEVEYAGEDAGNRGKVTFEVKPYYPEQVKEVDLYYLLPGEQQDDVNDDKHKVVMDSDADTWTGAIPEQNTGDVVRYYLRVKYIDGTKTYYPEEMDGGFNHDYGDTWPSYTVEEKSYDPVEYTTVTYSAGPLTKITFPSNPIPGEDINVELEYSSSVDITEARIYFDVGDNPQYVKKNKIKGEDLPEFTQTGVTINMKDAVAENGLAVGDSGNKTSFYVRMQDADGKEYYYDKDGNMHLDDTGAGGTTDESDAFKANPAIWNVFNVQ